MRLRIFGLIFLLTLSGCTFAFSTLEPVTPTPDILPRLDPSPTPSGSTLPLTCQVTDLNVYIDQEGGYCFAYPVRFTLDDSDGVRGPDLDQSLTPTFATFGVEIKPATEQPIREQAESYIRSFTEIDPATFTWTSLPVAGETGLMVEPVPTIGAWRFVFILHNGNLYRLSYWPVDSETARADIEELTQTTLGSFAFTR